jgi:hypothetical protein
VELREISFVVMLQIESVAVFVDPASIGPQRSIISILKEIGSEVVSKKQLEIEKLAAKLQYSVVGLQRSILNYWNMIYVYFCMIV